MDINKIKESACFIFLIEFGLREFLIRTFNDHYNSEEWHLIICDENPLPHKMIEYIKERKKDDDKNQYPRKIHPIYRLTFGMLQSLIDRKTNRKAITKRVHEKSRRYLSESLTIVLPLRNKVAHSILLNQKEYESLKVIYDTINGLIDINALINSKLQKTKCIDLVIDGINQMLMNEEINNDIDKETSTKYINSKILIEYRNLESDYKKTSIKLGNKYLQHEWVRKNTLELKRLKSILES